MTCEEAMSRMTALCSTAEHCESDVRQRLQRAGLAMDDADRVIEYLHKENYLNSARYCMAFSRDKLRFDHWGREKIARVLYMKGLPETDIRNAIDELPEEEYAQILDEAVGAKLRGMKKEDSYTMRNKLMRFVLGRGFTMDEAQQAIASHLTEDDG